MKTLSIMLFALLIAGCSTIKTNKLVTIPMEAHVNNPTEITASQLGRSIRYIPLETTDSTTLVGANPVVRIYGDKLIVSSDKQKIKVFNAQTGKYLNSIGELSRGNRGSISLSVYYINPYNGEIYVDAQQTNERHVYTLDGTYQRKVSLPKTATDGLLRISATPEMIDNRTFITSTDNSMGGTEALLNLYKENDTIATVVPRREVTPKIDFSEIASISIIKDATDDHGTIASLGGISISLKSKEQVTLYPGERLLWRSGDDVYFKENFTDTVYRVLRDTIIPVVAFDMGKYSVSYPSRYNPELAPRHTYISQILENEDIMFFEWLFDGAKMGVYDKASGKVTSAKFDDRISDDINDFISFNVHTTTPKGDFIALLDPLRIVAWAEENPTKKNQLPDLKEDDNIVIAIIE